jgi:hypothetical protein
MSLSPAISSAARPTGQLYRASPAEYLIRLEGIAELVSHVDLQVLATGTGEDQLLVGLGVQHEVPGERRRAGRDDPVRVRVREREGDLLADGGGC